MPQAVFLASAAGLANRTINCINLYAYCRAKGWQLRADAVPESVNFHGSEYLLAPRKPPGPWVQKLAETACNKSGLLHGLLRKHGIAVGRGIHTDISADEDYSLFLGQWFDCWDQVARFEGEIREAFAPSISLRQSMLEDGKWIGLHVRRGDYETWRGGAHFYSWEAYEQIARNLVRDFPESSLLVSSDSPPPEGWFREGRFRLNVQDAVLGFFNLTRCQTLAGPPSTYSLLSAWLGRNSLATIRGGVLSSPAPVTLELFRDFRP